MKKIIYLFLVLLTCSFVVLFLVQDNFSGKIRL